MHCLKLKKNHSVDSWNVSHNNQIWESVSLVESYSIYVPVPSTVVSWLQSHWFLSREKMRITGWDYHRIYSICVVISHRVRLTDYFFSLLGACLFNCSHMYNNNTIIIHLSCWDQHLLTIVVVLFQCRWLNCIELLTDNMIVPVIFYQILNSVAKLSSAYLSNWSLNLTGCHLEFRNGINMGYF